MVQMKLKVLHIVNWFPVEQNKSRGIFIKEHIASLDPHVEQAVYHVDAEFDSSLIKKDYLIGGPNNVNRYILKSKLFKYYKLKERCCYFILYYLFKIKKIHVGYDLINFHIAFPLLQRFRKIANHLNVPIIVNEQSSGYHFSFHIKGSLEKKRIKLASFRRLFDWQKDFICVSNALADDIIRFSRKDDLRIAVLPNIVSSEFDHFKKPMTTSDTIKFCMVTNWTTVKNPFPIFEALGRLKKEGVKFEMMVGGNGVIINDMKKSVEKHDIANEVKLLGNISKKEVATLLMNADALMHNANYETFSVICAESLFVGTPVLAAAVGGIKEFVSEHNGILVEDFKNYIAWYQTIKLFLAKRMTLKGEMISANARSRFNKPEVGKKYYSILTDFYNRSIDNKG